MRCNTSANTKRKRSVQWSFKRVFQTIPIIGALLAPLPVLAQSAAVNGLAMDPSGAAVPNVDIAFTNEDSGVVQHSKTNGSGLYTLSGVQPGKYALNAEAAGFERFEEKAITVETAQNLNLDIKLRIGNAKETVNVDGSGIQVNTTDGTVSTVVDQQFVENLPVNGRSFQSLLTIAPGIVDAPSGGGNQWSVNGQRVDENYFTVDGVSANAGIATVNPLSSGYGGLAPNFTALGTTQTLLSVDAMEEFRISTSNYSAEYGRSPGGQFTITSRAGANALHGSAFDYLRNNVMDANNYFNTYDGCVPSAVNTVNSSCLPRNIAQQPERQNDFGGTLGGPVIIPWLYNGKDRTFFFFSNENLILQTPSAAQTYYVPSMALRAEASPVFKAFLSGFPVSSGPDLGATVPGDAGFSQLVAGFSVPSRVYATSLRVDHNFSDKVQVFARFSRSPSHSSGYCQYCSTPIAEWESKTNRTTTGTVGVTTIISPRITNELRLGLTQVNSGGIYSGSGYGGSTPYNFQDVPGFVQGQWNVALGFNFPTGPEPGLLDYSTKNAQRQGNVVDTTTMVLGRHAIKFGVDFRRTSTWQADPGHREYGNLDSILDVEDGLVANYNVVSEFTSDKPQYYNTGLYIQDEWRATQRLDISLGLRWDVDPAPSDGFGHNPYTFSQVDNLSTMYLVPPGAPLWKTQWDKFAPRTGFAYRLRNSSSSETVVRGGIGLFYDTSNMAASTAGITGASASNNNYGCIQPTATNPATTCVTWPIALSNFPTIAAAARYPAEVDPHLKSPYTIEWNVALQQSLGANQAVTATYVGNEDQDLIRGRAVVLSLFQNPVPAGLYGNCCTYYDVNGSASKYNALQLQFQRRLSKGLQLLGGYTWAHGLDDATGNATNYSWTWASSDYDVRQNLQIAGTYLIPGHHSNGYVSQLIDNWNLDLRLSARTALPESIIAKYEAGDLTEGQYEQYYPNLVPGQAVYLYGNEYPGGKALNPNAFVTATDASGNPINGDFPRNGVRAFEVFETDLTVHKDFPLKERLILQFRLEAFNVLNHPMFGPLNTCLFCGPAVNGSGFGLASSTQNTTTTTQENPLYQTGGPRSLQVALKLKF